MLRGAIRRGAFPQRGHVFVFIPVLPASHFVDGGGRATVRPIALPRMSSRSLSHRNLRDGQAGTRSSAKVRWAERCVSLCVGGGGDEANDVASATGRARARRGFPCVPLHTLSMRVNNIRSMSPESGLCSSKSGRDTGAHDPIRPQTSKLR